jgi:hypothetical protein
MSAHADPTPTAIPFEKVDSGANSAITFSAFLVLTNEEQLRRVWALHNPPLGGRPVLSPGDPAPRPMPAVNFSTHYVIAFFAGQGSSCDKHYEVARVLEYPARFTVEIVYRPLLNCSCADRPVVPYELVQIPLVRTSKPIDYQIRLQPRACGAN